MKNRQKERHQAYELAADGPASTREPFQLIVRGRADARFPTATEIAAVADEEELAALYN